MDKSEQIIQEIENINFPKLLRRRYQVLVLRDPGHYRWCFYGNLMQMNNKWDRVFREVHGKLRFSYVRSLHLDGKYGNGKNSPQDLRDPLSPVSEELLSNQRYHQIPRQGGRHWSLDRRSKRQLSFIANIRTLEIPNNFGPKNLLYYHLICGHGSLASLRSLMKLKIIKFTENPGDRELLKECRIYNEANMRAKPHNKKHIPVTRKQERVHSDTMGPILGANSR